MAIQQTEFLSRQDFDEAVVRLRLNVTEIAKELGIPRTYLSEFRNGDRRLRPEQLAKLLDYFQSKGVEFTGTPDAANDPQPGEAVRVVRDAVIVCDRLTYSQRGAIQDRVRDLLAGLQGDLRKKAVEGFRDPYDDATDMARDKAIVVLAEVGVLYATLFDNCPFKTPSEALLNAPREAKTISDVLSLRFSEALKLISDTDQNTRDDSGDAGASGSGSNDPAKGDDGTPAATPPIANPEEKSNKLSWMP